MAKKTTLLKSTSLITVTSQKSCGKTTFTTFLIDALTVNGDKYMAFQVDDQKKLELMIGDKVVDLRPDPDKLVDDPTSAIRALTPLYDALRNAALVEEEKKFIVLDVGSNMTEVVTNFKRDVELAQDIAAWGVSAACFVPFYPLDPESTAQAAFAVRRMMEAVPNCRIVLVENRHGGSCERIVPGSIAERSHADLLAAAKGADKIVMPAIPREYWSVFEGAGMRFIKALALNPVEGAQRFDRSIAEIKVMKSSVAKFWRAMHEQLAQIVDLSKGGK